MEQPEAFWQDAAGELEWFSPWRTVMEGEGAKATWFNGGKLNLSHNCVDRHALGERKDKVALIWEGEPKSDGQAEVPEADVCGSWACRGPEVLRMC